MHKSQANRAIIAARAGIPATNHHGVSRNQAVSTNLAARVDSIIPIVHVHNRRSPRMTAAQKNSEGRRSEWAASPYFFTDPAWSRTVSDHTP